MYIIGSDWFEWMELLDFANDHAKYTNGTWVSSVISEA